MKETELKKRLNCNEEFRNHIQDFIEIFVEYYGEEERKYIEERFNSALLVGYLTEGQLKLTLYKLEQAKSNEIFRNIVSKTTLKGITINQLFGNYIGEEGGLSFELEKSHPIYKYGTFYDEFILGEKVREQRYYEELYKSLCNVVKSLNLTFNEYMEMVKTQSVPQKYENVSDKIKKLLLSYTDISTKHQIYKYRKKEAVKFLQTIDSSISIENIEEKIPQLTEINAILNDYRKGKERYEDFKREYAQYYSIIEHNKKLEQLLNNKYYRIFLQEILDLLPEQYREEMIKYIEEVQSTNLNNDLKQLLGENLNSLSLYEYFTQEMTEKLNSKSTNEWDKRKIEQKRIQYFKLFKKDLGDNYEEYLKHPDIFPKDNIVKQIVEQKKKYINNFKRDYYNNMLPWKNVIMEARERGFLIFNPNESAEICMEKNGKGMTCVIDNVVQDKNGKFKIAAKVIVNLEERLDGSEDHFIIHELNHLYELELISVTKNKVEIICGWDKIFDTFDTTEEKNIEINRERREYELFNEIINEIIAKDISKIMVKKGIEIFGKATEKSYRRTTAFDNTFYLVREFFETYKNEIFASRRNNHLQIIIDAVGRENFNDLNQLFSIHNKYLSGHNYDKLVDDLREGRKTKRTEIYKQLVEARDGILAKMREHYKLYNERKNVIRYTPEDFIKTVPISRIAEGVRKFEPKEIVQVVEHKKE
jgi:hypothetical protein